MCCATNGTVWRIPSNNSNSNGFTSSQITPPLVWGVDPTNSGNLPSPSALSDGANYNWTIQSQDNNGNSVQAQMNFETKTGPVSLPPASSNPLPAGEIGVGYTGYINASGGAGGGNYYFVVNGTTIPTDNTATSATNSDGLTFTNSGGNTLTVGGTPASVETVSLTIEVVDATNSNDTATVTYNVAINAEAPLAITLNSVPQGMVNMPYTFLGLNITGGASPYTVTYSNVPAGLQQSSYQIVGKPTSSGSTTVTVQVTDSSSSQESASTTFTLPVVPETVAAHNNYIKGQYARYAEQFYDGGVLESSTGKTLYRGGIVFAFTADGNGNITGGEADTDNPVTGYTSASQNGSLTGTYVVGSDSRGYLTAPGLWAIAGGNFNSSGQFSEFDLVRMDDAGSSPSTHHGAGHCYQQNTATALNTITPSGGSVYGMRGEDDKGNIETIAGSMEYGNSGTTMSFVQDIVDAGVYNGEMTGSGTVTSALDAYGLMMVSAGPTGQGAVPSVIYITNNTVGESLLMSASPLNTSNGSGFDIGQMRAQNAMAVAASYPLSGPMVMYTSGLDSNLTDYKAQETMLIGSTTSGSFTGGSPMLENEEGTFKTEGNPSGIVLTTDHTTGRTTMNGQTGDVFYVYDTGSALVLLGDLGNGGASITQDQLGWIEPQTVPSSGKWAFNDLDATYLSLVVPNGDYNNNFKSTDLTANSSGALTYFAQDKGGQNQADWDETLTDQAATATLVPDATYDPNGAYGIFDLNVTQSGATMTESYCIAISVDKATNSSTKGRLVCIDVDKTSPQISISQE